MCMKEALLLCRSGVCCRGDVSETDNFFKHNSSMVFGSYVMYNYVKALVLKWLVEIST